MAGFVQAYDKMNRWRKLSDGSELLLAGADNQAFPIPVKKNGSGQWYFDVAAGKDEILARRIGRDEIAAIDVCAAIADAQMEYFSQHHDGVKQYAQKFISDSGKQNGLYWESPEGQPRSPLGPLVAFATNEGFTVRPGTRQAFHGYFFRRLDSQGRGCQGRREAVCRRRQDDGGICLPGIPREIQRHRHTDVHHQPGPDRLSKESWQGYGGTRDGYSRVQSRQELERFEIVLPVQSGAIGVIAAFELAAGRKSA